MTNHSGMIVQKRMSFLSSLVWGLCTLLVTVIICAAGVISYGLNIFDRKTGMVVGVVKGALADMPQIVESLPPLLADALHDRRAIDYRDDLEIQVGFSDEPGSEKWSRSVITIRNTGQELISLLGVRVVVRDQKGNVLDESMRYAATPLALDNRDAPGPILPGSTRQMTAGLFRRAQDVTASYEITDLRVWVPEPEKPAADQNAAANSLPADSNFLAQKH